MKGWGSGFEEFLIEIWANRDTPPVNCKDINRWNIEVEELADRILWDSDYEDAHIYSDFPPEKSKELKDWMDIDDDYFTAIQPYG